MVVLVTGGAGFLGSHLVDELLSQGYTIRIFDIQSPKVKNEAEWFKGDILNRTDLHNAGRDVTHIFHLSAIADVNVALTNPVKCIEINEIGTVNLLEMARGMEVERLVLASSTWVYGNQEKVNEDSPIPLPDHIYTKTKIGQEQLVVAWNNAYGLPYTILRYGIPYGPRMRSNLVLSIFIRRAESGQPITIFGDGMQGRCFVNTADLAKGNIASLRDKGKNQIFNIAGAEFVTINDVVEILRSHYENLNVTHGPARPGDFQGVRVEIEKAKRLLRWEPKINYKEGVLKYLESLKTDS